MNNFENPNRDHIEWKDKESLSLLSKLKKEIFWNKFDKQRTGWLEKEIKQWLDSLKKNISTLTEKSEKKSTIENQYEKENKEIINQSKSDLHNFLSQIQVSSIDPTYIAHASKWPVESAQTVEVLKIHKELSRISEQKNPLARVAWSIANYLVS